MDDEPGCSGCVVVGFALIGFLVVAYVLYIIFAAGIHALVTG